MNATYAAALERELASLTRVVDAPLPPLGWGTDLSCTFQLSPTLEEVDPASPRAITEAVIRRYLTPRTGLADDGTYGLDIRSYLNRASTRRDLRAIAGALEGEALKDDRVARAQVELTVSLTASQMHVRVRLVPNDPRLVPFTFTFSVTDGGVLMGTIVNG